MHNTPAEQTISLFILSRKNGGCMNSIHGAKASAILYSLIETAKANNLRVYEYLEYLLDKLTKHADDTKRDFLKDLLPWLEVVQKKMPQPEKILI